MEFILRITFIGLVAFVPEPSGQKMTVLLVEARDGYTASDGTPVPEHFPLLLARSGSCAGDCNREEADLANLIYSNQLSPGERLANLRAALKGGAGWVLDQSELRIMPPNPGTSPTPSLHVVGAAERSDTGTGLPLPLSSTPPEDFDYVADLSELGGPGLTVDPSLLDGPEAGRTVAFLRLASGTVKAARLSGFEQEVVEFRFATAAEFKRGVDLSMPAAALADRVVVEIPIAGCSVRLENRNAVTAELRTIELAPANCNQGEVEVAIVNLPRHAFASAEEQLHHALPTSGPLIDHHFELFYDLLAAVPPRNRRPVPAYAGGGQSRRHDSSASAAGSSFLGALGLAPDRGLWSVPQCPVAQVPSP